MVSAIAIDPPSTIQVSSGLSQNRIGSSTSTMIRSIRVVISLPVRKSRSLVIWPTWYITAPVWVRSK